MTNSISFPNLFDVARSRVGVLENDQSVVNRTRLLILSDPESLYNNPDFGVGIKKYMWQYNSQNTRARIEDNIREQLRAYEPCCVPNETQFSEGLVTEDVGEIKNYNRFTMTVGISTIFGNTVEVNLDDLQEIIEKFRDQIGDGYNV